MAPRVKKIAKVVEIPLPVPKECPLCKKPVTPYLLSGYGMIYCNPSTGGCGLKLQRQEGLRTVIEFWNRRACV